MLIWLLACSTLETPAGVERARGGLWLEGSVANAPGTTLAVVANSELPCEPEATPDDPRTQADEAASAQAWWEGELASAFGREGAALLLVVLHGVDSDDSFAVAGPLSLAGEEGTGSAVGRRVEEVAVEEPAEALHEWILVEEELGTDLAGSVGVSSSATHVVLQAELGEWRADAVLTRCQNVELVRLALDGIAAVGLD